MKKNNDIWGKITPQSKKSAKIPLCFWYGNRLDNRTGNVRAQIMLK